MESQGIIHRFITSQFLKFSVVGTAGTIIDFGLLNLMVQVLNMPLYLSATLAFLAAVINNFLMNKYWTFKNYAREKKNSRQFIQFLLVSVVGLLINLGIMFFLVEYANLWYNLAKAAAILVVLIWNYLANKAWTFQKNTSLPKTPI